MPRKKKPDFAEGAARVVKRVKRPRGLPAVCLGCPIKGFLHIWKQQWSLESLQPNLRTGTKNLSETAIYPKGFARAVAHLHLDHNRQEAGYN